MSAGTTNGMRSCRVTTSGTLHGQRCRKVRTVHQVGVDLARQTSQLQCPSQTEGVRGGGDCAHQERQVRRGRSLPSRADLSELHVRARGQRARQSRGVAADARPAGHAAVKKHPHHERPPRSRRIASPKRETAFSPHRPWRSQ